MQRLPVPAMKPGQAQSSGQDASESVPLMQSSSSNSVVLDVPPEIAAAGRHAQHAQAAPAAGAGSSDSGDAIIGTCRICFEAETAESMDADANPLISPCLCSGGSKYVHRQCLQQWRTTNHRADAAWQCEVCKYRYQYRRMWWAHLLGSPVTLAAVFVLVMACAIGLLGFIPITNRAWAGSSSGSSGGGQPAGGGVPPVMLHVLNGVVMLAICGLVLSALLLVGRACGMPGLLLLPDSSCPACWVCLDLHGGGGIGWAPLVECASAGECGIAMLAVLAVVMLAVGLLVSAYLVYGLLWMGVQSALSSAQRMVENVQQQPHGLEQRRRQGSGGGSDDDDKPS